jgi:RNA polymerase sigma-70 factor (ECF subfamily)
MHIKAVGDPAEKIDKFEIRDRIVAGDQTAMKVLYDEYSGALFHFSRNYLADPHDASDIVHETMMEVWRNAARFEGRSSIKSWMFTIARNKSIDRNRKGRRLHYTDSIPESEDEGVDPAEAMEASQDQDLIRSCVKKLSDSHRSVIHLVFFQNLSYQEVSDIEGIPVGTVKTRVLHAKKKLAHLLALEGRKSI